MDTPRLLKDRYRLGRVIGRGGMGVVWLATDEVLDRPVAVKEVAFPPGLPDEEQETLRRRTLREARTNARLNHPNVVGVYDIVDEENRPWIVMEFVPSRSLAETVRADGPLSPERTAEIGLQLLGGLRAAHAAGVLHRDVKPSNVLLAEDGRVVLGDFGIATAEGGSTVTSSGVLIGSPSYMAPERARGHKAGPASDLWSLGATLYTAVEGRPPFSRDSAVATLAALVMDDPDDPERAGPLWPLIRSLLQRDPALRPPAESVAESLRAIVGGSGGGYGTRLSGHTQRPSVPWPRPALDSSPSLTEDPPVPEPDAGARDDAAPGDAWTDGVEPGAGAEAGHDGAESAGAGAGDAAADDAGPGDIASGGVEPDGAGSDGSALGGAGSDGSASGGAGTRDAADRDAGSSDAGSRGAEPDGAGSGDAASDGAGSGGATSGGAESGSVGPGSSGSGRVDPGSVGSGRVGASGVGSGRAGSGSVGSGRAGSGSVGSGRIRSSTGSGRVEPDGAERGGIGAAGVEADTESATLGTVPSGGGVSSGGGAPPAATTRTIRTAGGGSPPSPPNARRTLAILMTAAAILTVVLLAWAASDLSSGDHPSRRNVRHAGTTPSRSASHPSATTSPSASASPPSPTASPTTSPTAGTLPAGYRWHHDRTGFSIAVPDGWSATHHGHYLYVEDPHSSRILIVDQTNTPKSDPLADWRQQESARRGGYSGYHRVRLESVHYPQARKTADWEFTYNGSSGRNHVLNRNILVNGKHAYALYWSVPDDRWKSSRSIFDAFATSFQPATD